MAKRIGLGTAAVITARTKAIEMTAPELVISVRAPAATPRRCGDTAPIMADVFGELNTPEPIPTAKSQSAACQYGESTTSVVISARPAAVRSIPAVARPRDPWRSASTPAIGDA